MPAEAPVTTASGREFVSDEFSEVAMLSGEQTPRRCCSS
jgi:hypothetical protein